MDLVTFQKGDIVESSMKDSTGTVGLVVSNTVTRLCGVRTQPIFWLKTGKTTATCVKFLRKAEVQT